MKTRCVSSHTRCIFTPACAARPPAPGHVSCRLSGRAKPVLSAMCPRAKGAKRLGAQRCAQDCSCARVMGTIAWSKACARLFLRCYRAAGATATCPPPCVACATHGAHVVVAVPPAPTGHEGQEAFARHVRRTPDKTRATSGRFDLGGGKNAASLARTLHGCAAMAVSFLQGNSCSRGLDWTTGFFVCDAFGATPRCENP